MSIRHLHLKEILAALWRRILAVPVALKVIGLVVLPLLVVSTAGLLILRQRVSGILDSADAHGAEAIVLTELANETTAVFVISAVIGLSVALLLTTVFVRPLRSLVHAMRRVRGGDLAVSVPVWGDDEIGEVQREFNVMLNSLRESRAQLLTQQQELTQLNQENLQLLSDVRVKSERLQQLLHRAILAQEAERQRLARELHDETGQALTSLTLQLKALQEETELDVIYDRLNGLRYLTSRTVEEVRRLSIDLRPATLDDLGLVPAIRAYLDGWTQHSGIELQFIVQNPVGRLPSDLEIILYRVVQEGVTNIARHSHARTARIMLDHIGRSVLLTIADDGDGIDLVAHRGDGLGLAGMRERVEMAGGHWQIISAPAAGTRILIDLPVTDEAQ
ncbi:two-component system, NarL family, sensor histidine kinase UhpB [Gammaproteobacteria bacterium]|nr:two-component system, NarL family, sensor histidine kinase UhpB [Gammaproteobacteria bacterium]